MREILGVILVIVGFVMLFNEIDKSLERTKCEQFSLQANRETKYVDYSYWSNDCLTKQTDGKWISAYNLRGE